VADGRELNRAAAVFGATGSRKHEESQQEHLPRANKNPGLIIGIEQGHASHQLTAGGHYCLQAAVAGGFGLQTTAGRQGLEACPA